MKTARFILACSLAAATVQAAGLPRPSSLNIPSTSTPLEEYGLSIGDVTVSRVINPLGQLRVGSPVMLNRHLTSVKNPWAELAPGTALIVDGKKAVVQQLIPASPPADAKPLLVEVVIETIAGQQHVLKWKQQLNSLNRAVSAEARDDAVKLVQEKLRTGSQLIVNDKRVVVTDTTLKNKLNSGLVRDLELSVQYQSVSRAKGALTGNPSASEAISDPAWIFRDPLAAPLLQNQSLINDTVKLVTWEFSEMDGNPDNEPLRTILHRAYGVLHTLELTSEKEVMLTVGFKLGVKNHMHTHIYRFGWKQQVDESGEMTWMMDHAPGNFTELYRVNDTNIKFTVMPDSLLAANRKAAQLLDQNRSGFTPGRVDVVTLTNYLSNLEEIIKSDASQAIKMDVRRKAVISLAGYYEHMAESYKALAQEHLARAEITENNARRVERRDWFNKQQIDILTETLLSLNPNPGPTTEPLTVSYWSEPVDQSDEFLSIGEMIELLESDKIKYAEYTPDKIPEIKLAIESKRRRGAALPAMAHDLRTKAKEYRAQSDALQRDVIHNFTRAQHLWKEYVVRTEGLARDGARLTQQGVPGNEPPPDPLIPEIFLRQAWIYRQIGRPDLATDKTQDVLKAAIQQKIDNLTRYGRIFLVSRSQIADTLSESAKTVEDYIDANEKYEYMLQSEQKEYDTNQIELKLLRGLYRANNKIQSQIRLLDLKLKTGPANLTEEQQRLWRAAALGSLNNINNSEIPASFTTRIERMRNDREKLKQSRMDNWKKMSQHADAFIERTGEFDQESSYNSHFQSGEVRYYQIISNKSLGKDENVQLQMEVLLSNESTPMEQREAWAATRVRVVIDIANMLYTNGKDLETRAERLKNSSGTPVMATVRNPDGSMSEVPNWKPLLDSARSCFTGARVYYQWALQHDQTYRSQLLLRQQIAFCHDRLAETNKAKEMFKAVYQLSHMHLSDVNNDPTLRLTRILSELRMKNLERLIDREKRTQPNN